MALFYELYSIKPVAYMDIWNASFCTYSYRGNWVWNPDESFIYDLKKGTSREAKNIRGYLDQSWSERQQETQEI